MNPDEKVKKKQMLIKSGVEFKTDPDEAILNLKKRNKSGGIRSSELSTSRKSRMSFYDIHGRTRKLQNFMPTYRLEPKNVLRLDPVQNVIKSVILQSEKYFIDKKFKATRMAQNIVDICSEINTRIKLFNFDRYRLVSYAIFSQKYNQSMSIQMGFLWNALEDKWTYYVYDHPFYNIIIVVFGIYYD